MIPAESAVESVMTSERRYMDEAIAGYAHAMDHLWFAQKILKTGMLSLLEYANPETIVTSMHALLYAYSHSGTREGFVQLCLGLFGRDSIIIIAEEPAVISLEIYVQNEAFFYALSQGSEAIHSHYTSWEDDLAIHAITLLGMTGDPIAFLEQFLPAGVIIKNIDFGMVNDEIKNTYRSIYNE